MKKIFKFKLLVVLVLIAFLSGCSQMTSSLSQDLATSNSKHAPNQGLKIVFLDVGQGDCILVCSPDGKTMLIDAGNSGDGNQIVKYIKQQGISKLDIVIASHPHADHIGSMNKVLKSFDVKQFIAPKVTTNTKTFSDMLEAVKEKGLKITTAAAGMKLDIGNKVKADVLAPNSSKYDDLNNYSVVLKLTYGSTKFLLEADAEALSEKEMIKKGYDLSSTLIQLGHHGSSSSTSKEFLSKVNPKYSLVLCGKLNDYHHPHKATMDKLKKSNIKVFRTDENGTVICNSNGKEITFNVAPGSYKHGK